MNRFLFIIVIAFVWKKNGNQCCKILSTGKTYKPKGKTSLLQKMYFSHCADGQAVLTEGFHSQYFTGYCNEQNPRSVFDRNEHIDK